MRRLAAVALPLLLAGFGGLFLLGGEDLPSPEDGASRTKTSTPHADPLVLEVTRTGEEAPATTAAPTPRLEGAVRPPHPVQEFPSSRKNWGPTAKDRRRVRGRLITDAGLPVPGGEVHLTNHLGRRPRVPPGLKAKATTDAQGRYELETPAPGTYGAAASVEGYGTGWTGPFEVKGPEPVSAPDLVVRGDGNFSGVVVFPDGQPVVGAQVSGCVDLQRGGSWGQSPYPGVTSVQTRTDGQGRFRIAGLRPGPYNACVDGIDTLPPSIQPVSGDDDLRFVVQARQLRVLIRNPLGAPHGAALLDVFHPANGSHSRRRTTGGEVTFFGEGGKRFVLCAHAEECVPCVLESSIPTDAWTRTVVLIPRPRTAEVGKLRLGVFDPDGRPVERYRVRVRTLETGTGIPWLERIRPDDAGILHDVPPGRWRLLVDPLGPDEDDAPCMLFTARSEVEVRAHATTAVRVTCRRGGRIRITSTWHEDLAESDEKGDIDLEGPVPTPVHWLWPDPEEPELGPLLEPGRWVVVVTGEGFETQRLPTHVEAGRIVDVKVHVVPEKHAP